MIYPIEGFITLFYGHPVYILIKLVNHVRLTSNMTCTVHTRLWPSVYIFLEPPKFAKAIKKNIGNFIQHVK